MMSKQIFFAVSLALNVALIGFGLLYVFTSREKLNNNYNNLDKRILVIEERVDDLVNEVKNKIEIDKTIDSENQELKNKIQEINSQLDILEKNYNKLRIYKEKLDEVFQIQ